MAVDLFLVMQSSSTAPITAEPTQDSYFAKAFPPPQKVAIEIRQFSLDTENPSTIGSATGGTGTGKAKLNPLVVEKSVDMASSSLFKICAAGGHFPLVQLYVRKAGGTTTPKPYLVYGFDTVFVNKIEWSASEGDDLPIERVEFAYGGLLLGYYTQKPDGTLGTKVQATWSQMTNTEALTTDASAGF